MYYNSNVMRIPKTLTVEQSVLTEVERTKGDASTSGRVNELLKRALEQERREQLEQEAERFYAVANQQDREEERAFQKATQRTLMRD
jgi:hypothetical protein